MLVDIRLLTFFVNWRFFKIYFGKYDIFNLILVNRVDLEPPETTLSLVKGPLVITSQYPNLSLIN